MKGFFTGIWDIATASSAVHSHLRERLLATICVTVVVDVVVTVVMFLLERHQAGSDIRSLWDAFFWTTSQLVTISSSMENPTTVPGQLVALALDIYAIIVVTTLAGAFGSFFHHRSEDRLRPPKP